ncbi:MAG: FAD-dependent monooxygenase [Steroidobacteraceae bacterium]
MLQVTKTVIFNNLAVTTRLGEVGGADSVGKGRDGMRAIVCGAGIAGLTLAGELARKGWDVVLLEQAPALRDGGYMIDFSGSGYDAVEQMGLLGKLKTAQRPIARAEWADSNGKRKAALDYAVFQKSLKGRLLSFMRGDLERILHESLPASVQLRFGCSIEDIKTAEGSVEVKLSDGSSERTDLLVGADGMHSRVRELVFGDEKQFVRPLGFHAAAYIFEDIELHGELQGSFKMASKPGKEVAFYPLDGNKVASFFIHRTQATQRPERPLEELIKMYGDMQWHVPESLKKAESVAEIYYDLVAQVKMATWHKGRAVLVGDAAYAVSLLAGMGASLAIGGSYVLAHELDTGQDIEASLRRYESGAKDKILHIQESGRRMAGFFAPPSSFRIAVRNALIRIINLPVLNRLLAGFLAPATESIVPLPRSSP